MYEFEKIALTGKSYARDNGGTCYLFPNDNYYRVVSLNAEKIAKGYQVFNACVDVMTIPASYLEDIDEKPALDDRDIVTVIYQFVTRAYDAARADAAQWGDKMHELVSIDGRHVTTRENIEARKH